MAINSTEDVSLPIPSRHAPLVERSRFISDAWWPFFQGLFKTLRNSIGAIQETVDQLNGVWTLSVNTNNRVTGQLKLDGSAALTTFSILADRFIIIHPSVDGTSIQAFITGLVDGVSTIGINGNLIVDGTVIARNIAADAIIASKIAAGAVVAGKIAANAITAGTIAAGTIVAGDIAANTITANEIAAGAITADELAAGSVTAIKINVASLSAIAANVGTLTAGVIQSTDGKLVINLTTGVISITT